MKKITYRELLNLIHENKEPIQVEYKGEVYKKHAISDYENEKNGLLLSRVIAEECTLEAMTWSKVITICDDDILDDEEKEYLLYIIKPFKKYISTIEKTSVDRQEQIIIKYHDYFNTNGSSCIFLPTFKRDTMYKGMESFKEYTLEELGL